MNNELLAELRQEYSQWSEAPDPLPRNWAQSRGFALERLIRRLLEHSGLSPRASYKISGEQIDGSFVYHGRFYLLEAKWVQDRVPASDLYTFKAKVDGKLVGTVGVYISLSGYGEDAINALVAGKSVNLILFDASDWEASLDPATGFLEVLSTKLRIAAEEGSPYFAFGSAPSRIALPEPPVVVITEGSMDLALVSALLTRLEPELLKQVQITTAGGALNVPRVAKFVVDSGVARGVVILLDDDEAGRSVKRELEEVERSDIRIVFAEPHLDKVLEKAIDARFISYDQYRLLRYSERLRFVREAILQTEPSELIRHSTVQSIIHTIKEAVDERSQL